MRSCLLLMIAPLILSGSDVCARHSNKGGTNTSSQIKGRFTVRDSQYKRKSGVRVKSYTKSCSSRKAGSSESQPAIFLSPVYGTFASLLDCDRRHEWDLMDVDFVERTKAEIRSIVNGPDWTTSHHHVRQPEIQKSVGHAQEIIDRNFGDAWDYSYELPSLEGLKKSRYR